MRRLHFLQLIAIVGVTAAVWPSTPTRPHLPCRAAFELVEEGMTYNEVCVLVGGPPGDYSDGRVYPGGIPFQGTGFRPGPDYTYIREWTATDGTLAIRFSEGGRVRWILVMPPMFVEKPPFWMQIRAWFRL